MATFLSLVSSREFVLGFNKLKAQVQNKVVKLNRC
jgi:hypothetical protein